METVRSMESFLPSLDQNRQEKHKDVIISSYTISRNVIFVNYYCLLTIHVYISRKFREALLHDLAVLKNDTASTAAHTL